MIPALHHQQSCRWGRQLSVWLSISSRHGWIHKKPCLFEYMNEGQIFTFDIHKTRQAGTTSHKNSFKLFVLLKTTI